ncbi:hypothetical protein [Neptunicella marina]|uniref:Uncharacterized protein n=1 Tax=Neptunicella marina TaxID=2125989 RepID=A0A8J6IU37_9ALTE|nr:hypothetical protein [Neptunicella marina]MBC3766279.1 hypothetical protein [Neptunicella marina]
MSEDFQQARARIVDKHKYELYRQYFSQGNRFLRDLDSHDAMCGFFKDSSSADNTQEQRYKLHLIVIELSLEDYNRIQSWMKTKRYRERKAKLGAKQVSITLDRDRFEELKRLQARLDCETYNDLVKELARRYNVTNKQARRWNR